MTDGQGLGPLFDQRREPAARRTDPGTSKTAAAKARAMAPSLREQILEVLEQRGSYGATAYEVADILGRPIPSVSPRFRELQARGQVFRTRLARTGELGVRQQVWVAAGFYDAGTMAPAREGA